MTEANRAPLSKKRTAWAIAVAFVLYGILFVIYALSLFGLLYVGPRYDHSNLWTVPAVLVYYVPAPLASFGAMITTCRLFSRANKEAVFYAFATGIIFVSLTILIEPNVSILQAFIAGALGIAGARAGLAYIS